MLKSIIISDFSIITVPTIAARLKDMISHIPKKFSNTWIKQLN